MKLFKQLIIVVILVVSKHIILQLKRILTRQILFNPREYHYENLTEVLRLRITSTVTFLTIIMLNTD